MIRKVTFLSILAAMVLALSAAVFGQSTTGDLEGTIKDPKGAVVPGVSVTVQGVSVGFSRTVQTNAEGVYRVLNVPQGTYKITTAAARGFGAATAEAIVAIEKTATADITLGINGSVNVVQVENDPLGVAIDTSDSKVQTTIPRALIDKLPSGTSFTSLLKISPGTRAEPLSGGFQVDGASGSENTFIIDGQPVENFRTGTLNGVNNIPTSLVSELQIKTGGFEAEHGGASGGVVSVSTKSGSDAIHGNVGTAFESSKLQPTARFIPQRFQTNSSCAAPNNNPTACAAVYAGNPQTLYAIRQPKDDYLNSYPDMQFSGPIIKRHVWFLGQWSPQSFDTNRTSNFYQAIGQSNFSTGSLVLVPQVITATNPYNVINYHVNTKFNYGFSRFDYAFFDKLRGTVSYLWNPSVTRGAAPFAIISTSTPTSTNYAGTLYPSGEYTKLQGGRTNSDTFNTSATYTPTSRLVINGRLGKEFLNEKGTPYALNNIPRYSCGGTSAVYATIATNCVFGFQNVTANSITTKDVSRKLQMDFDAAFFVSNWGGRHEFKGGYTWGRTSNDVQTGNAGTGLITFFYGQDFSVVGASLPCAIGTASCLGVGRLARSGTNGYGQNTYQAIFFQDKWQPTKRLTLNLGFRDEKEDLPSFNAGDILAGTAIPGIVQGWGRKWAPRLGGAYDVTGSGKTKIYASYGWFYDRLKFEAPRGSFGGDFFREDYFPITAAHPNYDYYTPQRILGNWTDPRGGGNPSTAGGLSLQQVDFRIPSNLTSAQFTALGLVVTGVDPNLKSFRQDEFTVGFEHEFSRSYTISTRFTRKNVAHAMEDHAILGLGEAENYPVGNPGEGLDLKLDQANGTAKSARPQRLYNGVEFVFTKRFGQNYFYSANYTWSRLFGNYSGLASSDEAGRTAPGVDRFFDYPINGYTATGNPDNGLLATDRTHTFKAYGGYTWNWWGSKTNTTDFGFFQQILEGTPQTTFITVVKTSIPLSKRGDLGRTPTFWQTDLNMTHRYRFGRDGKFTLAVDLVATNVFNNDTVTSLNTTRYRTLNTISGSDIDPAYTSTTQTLIPILNKILTGQIGSVLAQLENGGLPSLANRPNPKSALYGLPSAYQATRNVRFGFRFIF